MVVDKQSVAISGLPANGRRITSKGRLLVEGNRVADRLIKISIIEYGSIEISGSSY